MFEEPLYRLVLRNFFDRLEMQSVNILQCENYARDAVLTSMNALLRGAFSDA